MSKRIEEMNAAELEEATKEFDAPFAFLKIRKPTPAELRQLTRVQAKARARGAGRPPIGKGAERINITLERGLLKRVDKVARNVQMSRSELIARSLEIALGMEASNPQTPAAPAMKRKAG